MFDKLTVWNMQTLHPERIEYTPGTLPGGLYLIGDGLPQSVSSGMTVFRVQAGEPPMPAWLTACALEELIRNIGTVADEDASQPLPYTEYDDPGERLGLNEHPEDVADERGEPPADDDERDADEGDGDVRPLGPDNPDEPPHPIPGPDHVYGHVTPEDAAILQGLGTADEDETQEGATA